jgi:uncharacterized integral membrane protein
MAFGKKKDNEITETEDFDNGTPRKSNVPIIIKLFLVLVILVILILLIVQNLETVKVSLVFYTFPKVPVIAIILVCVMLGFLLGLITMSMLFARKKAKKNKEAQFDEDDDI